MKSKDVLLISSASGNPRDVKTWSGTPFNIVNSFEKLGRPISTFYYQLDMFQKSLCRIHHRISGYGCDVNRGYLSRFLRAKSLSKYAGKNRINKILHTGTLDLPVEANINNSEHFLFCDSTWNLWSRYATNINNYTKKMMQLAESLEKKAYGQIKHFFTISKYVRNNLIEHYRVSPHKITVVGTGIGNIRAFYGEKDYEHGYILFIAKSRFKDKGGDLLIAGFKIALKKFPHLKLIVVGNDEYKKFLKETRNLIVKGHISWQELEKLFHNAALFTMPAINEPWGLVYLEALMCRVPILGLNRNSLPEITQEGRFGFLVQNESPRSIAKAIIDAFANTNRLKEMGILGQKYCMENFSWKKTVKKMGKIIFNERPE